MGVVILITNRMGNNASAPEQLPTHGFHILRVKPNSPGSQAKLKAYFDFIVGVNDKPVRKEDFVGILHEYLNKPLRMTMLNIQDDTMRNVELTPSSTWSENENELLGVSILFCEVKSAKELVWHIMEVLPNSPASTAGLRPFTDFIVGSTASIFQESEDFFTLVRTNMNKPLEFFVYNTESDDIRMVTLTPNRNWGGSGSLGCNVAYGILHRIPTVKQYSDTPEPEPLPSHVLAQAESISSVPPVYPSFQSSPIVPSGSLASPMQQVPPVQYSTVTDQYLSPVVNKDQSATQFQSPPREIFSLTPTTTPTTHTTRVDSPNVYQYSPVVSSISSKLPEPVNLPRATSTVGPSISVQMPQFSSAPNSPMNSSATSNLDITALKKRQEELQKQLRSLQQEMKK